MAPLSLPSGLPGCIEVDPGAMYLCCLTPDAALPDSEVLAAAALCHVLDPDLVYEPFCADFGPCNLAHTWRICQSLRRLTAAAAAAGLPLLLLVGAHPHRHANAAAALGAYRVLLRGMSAGAACAPLRALCNLPPFRDASSGTPLFGLGVEAVVAGLARARDAGFLAWHAGGGFDLEEYEHYEQVENGDLNWIVPGKLLAFSGPSATPRHYGGWRTFTPEDYVPYFRATGVQAVVRLNRRMYDAARFTAHGLAHHELYFPDGTCPARDTLHAFLALAESARGALAVHCKAGLGRTGVLICAYMIKHHGFGAEEAMGYIRVARPGSVIGPQQLYLRAVAPELAAQGAALRALAAQRALPPLDRGERGSPAADQENGGDWTLASGRAGAVEIGAASAAATSASAKDPQRPALHLHVEAGAVAAEAAPDAVAAARRALAARSASGSSSLGTARSASASVSTPPRSTAATPAPPSSTKRVLAPNGQPRKIPLAMDFDKALPSDLEDLAADDGSGWRLSTLPSTSSYAGSSRMGAGLLNAAERGAAAFAGVFRTARRQSTTG